MSRIVEVIPRAWAAIRARRTAWLVAGAVGFGALAVLGARNYIGERVALEKARLQPRQEMVEVVVARRDLRRGDVVGPETMAVRALPREFAPGGAVTPSRFDALAGTRLQVAMRAGEPLLASIVAQADAAPISSRVRPGIRAMTIAVDEVNSLSGMLQPGDRIDLLLSVRPVTVGGVPQPETTRTVMQGVPVMATGRQSRAIAPDEGVPGRAYTSITVEVDPVQAQKLVVAQRAGKLTAVLRNPEDRAQVAEARLDVNTLLGLPPPPLQVVAPPPAKVAAVEVIVGGRGALPGRGAAAEPAAGPSPAPGASPIPGASQGPGSQPLLAPPFPPGTTHGSGQGGSTGVPAPEAGFPGSGPGIPRLDERGRTSPAEGVWVPLSPPQTIPLHR